MSVQVTDTSARVVHGHADTGGSRDRPKGSTIKSYRFDEHGHDEAIKRAYAQHYAITKSQERDTRRGAIRRAMEG